MPRGQPTSVMGFRPDDTLRRRLQFLAVERQQKPARVIRDLVEKAVTAALRDLANEQAGNVPTTTAVEGASQ